MKVANNMDKNRPLCLLFLKGELILINMAEFGNYLGINNLNA